MNPTSGTHIEGPLPFVQSSIVIRKKAISHPPSTKCKLFSRNEMEQCDGGGRGGVSRKVINRDVGRVGVN